MSFASSFHFLAAKYLQYLRPDLVVLPLDNERALLCRRLYLDERKVIRFPIAVELCPIYYCLLSMACLGFFEFPWMGVLFFPRDLYKVHFYL